MCLGRSASVSITEVEIVDHVSGTSGVHGSLQVDFHGTATACRLNWGNRHVCDLKAVKHVVVPQTAGHEAGSHERRSDASSLTGSDLP
jgi:hypothetical protein